MSEEKSGRFAKISPRMKLFWDDVLVIWLELAAVNRVRLGEEHRWTALVGGDEGLSAK